VLKARPRGPWGTLRAILAGMFKRQTSGSVVCTSCGYLVGVNDDTCYNCGRRNPGLWGFAPAFRRLGHDLGFVHFMTAACLIVYGLTLLMTGPGALGGGGLFNILSPSSYVLAQFGASGAVPVFRLGRWWTVLSASWLHASVLHIAFNVMWIRQLAPAVAELYGPGRTVIVYTVAGVCGFGLSTIAGQYLWFMPSILRGAGLTVGASASIFGLLGALVYYGRRTGSSLVHGQAMSWAVTMFIFGLIMPGVDNFAHAGGFAGGFIAGRLLDPLKPERVDHIVIAVGCLLLSIVSILASLLVPLR
jgi:rhomboid protease GluP